MGYVECHCQICGVSFNIGRIRRPDEPVEAAWNYSGYSVVDHFDNCESRTCSSIQRTIPPQTFIDRSLGRFEELEEHLAGQECVATNGYSGWRISLEEMKDCTRVQCLAMKDKSWQAEPDDHDYEREARSCFVTGISAGPPAEWDVRRLQPIRHNVQEGKIGNEADLDDVENMMPMHAYCFELFRRWSLERFGIVNIDGLFDLWLKQGEFRNRFTEFPDTADLEITRFQLHQHLPGTEYLVANPVHVSGLAELIESCVVEDAAPEKDIAFTALTTPATGEDPFASFPPELKLMTLLNLGAKDICNLRLSSRSFVQLPQKVFREAVREMPWVWEQEECLDGKAVDWHLLCLKLGKADGTGDRDQAERARLHDGSFDAYKREDPMKILYGPGPQWPKATQLHGLRNRRRLYWDIEEILDRIAALE